MLPQDLVLQKIRQYWPDEDPQAVLDILNTYGDSEMERGRGRVHLAILKLCEGKLEKLPDLIAMAKQDYRDVLAYAEYPEQMKLGFLQLRNLSSSERKAIKERDEKQYKHWLKNS